MATESAGALRMPPPLMEGDAVALFSPSSHSGRNGEPCLAAARQILEGWGLRPLEMSAPQPRHLYLAGPDRERAATFQRLYVDPDVKALFATRGGYGAGRMLPHLDARAIAEASPKAVVGMSDVVALFAYLHTVAGVGACHGPCLAAPSFQASPQREADLAALRALLFDPASAPSHPCTLLHEGASGAAPVRTAVEGRLVGGNLAVLAAGMGTSWALETEGCILFLEEVNEAPYRIDRYLTQLRQAGRLDRVAGVVFGHLEGCESEPPGLLAEVLADLFAGAPYPVAMGLAAGHGVRNVALPLGRRARLAWDGTATAGPAVLQAL